MSAAARDFATAVNWRITLLGLNLAAWLVGALLVAVLFVHHEMGSPALYPGFGYALPMFDDVPVFYTASVDSQPVVGLRKIGALKPTAGADQQPDRPLARGAVGTPRPLAAAAPAKTAR